MHKRKLRAALLGLAAALGLATIAPVASAQGPYQIDGAHAASLCEYRAATVGSIAGSTMYAAAGSALGYGTATDPLVFMVTDYRFAWGVNAESQWAVRVRVRRNYLARAAYYNCWVNGHQWGYPGPDTRADFTLRNLQVEPAPNWLIDTTQPGWSSWDLFY